ncbi:MAG: peptidoglycan DD-metalloendopeptidase family protein [bacterium]
MRLPARRAASVIILWATLIIPVRSASSPHAVTAADPAPQPFLSAARAAPGHDQLPGYLWPWAFPRIPIETLLGAQQDRRPDGVRGFQASREPATTIVVQQGQTVWDLARSHGITVEEIAAANGLADPALIQVGQRLDLPATGIRTAERKARQEPSAVSSGVVRLLWPARGALTSRFGWRWNRHHNGIDIAAPFGAPILAAHNGHVIYAGWHGGYGRTVVIDHGNGFTTLYGHASRLLVTVGRRVDAGDKIAGVGSTGNARGPHLHFEIRFKQLPVDPLPALQPGPQRVSALQPAPPRISPVRTHPPRPRSTPGMGYRVQVGAFRLLENAEIRAAQLRRDGFDVSSKKSGNLYMVQITNLRDRLAATQLAADLRARGYDAFVAKE